VTDVVLAEAVWTLRSAFEDRDAVTLAADMFEHGNCGFSDCLVVAKQARHGCDFTATFVRGMRKLPKVKLL
jgi:predicted nucleic-acid-binding protein